MAKATGERTFNSSEQQVTRYENKPLPVADYRAKIRTDKAEIAVAQGPGKLPYINGVVFELMNTAQSEGGKNRTIRQRFFLNTSPDKDGKASVNRGAGVVALAKATGRQFKGVTLISRTKIDDAGNEKQVEILNPNQMLAWIKTLDGVVVKLKSKNGKPTDDGVKWPEVDFFHEREVEEEDEDEEQDEDEEKDEETDDDESDDEDEDEDEDEEVEDEKPKKKKSKK